MGRVVRRLRREGFGVGSAFSICFSCCGFWTLDVGGGLSVGFLGAVFGLFLSDFFKGAFLGALAVIFG